MIRALKTVDDVVDALGGTAKVARLIEGSQQSVSNARASGRLPPTTFVVMTDALAKISCEAPAKLWSMKEPAQKRRAS